MNVYHLHCDNCDRSVEPTNTRCRYPWDRTLSGLVFLGLALTILSSSGCDKAKEIADNAVNKVKEDFKSAKNKIEKASQPTEQKSGSAGNPPVQPTQPKSNLAGNSTNSIEAFKRLQLSQIKDQNLIDLGKDSKVAQEVTELKLTGSSMITSEGLNALANFPNLEKLEIGEVNATAGNMSAIGKLKSLKILNVANNRLSDKDFQEISSLTLLEEINLMGNLITDDGFRSFAQMPKLARINVDRMGHLQGKGFKYVNKNSVKEIYGNGSSIGYFAFQSLAGSESLETLWLNRARVTDKAMQGIARCPNLKDLRLEKNDLTNKGIGFLKNHKSLENIVLAGNVRLTNQALGNLSSIKTLKLVNVRGTQCSDTVKAEFLKYVPGCDLVF